MSHLLFSFVPKRIKPADITNSIIIIIQIKTLNPFSAYLFPPFTSYLFANTQYVKDGNPSNYYNLSTIQFLPVLLP